jgi:hypothetical protein
MAKMRRNSAAGILHAVNESRGDERWDVIGEALCHVGASKSMEAGRRSRLSVNAILVIGMNSVCYRSLSGGHDERKFNCYTAMLAC